MGRLHEHEIVESVGIKERATAIVEALDFEQWVEDIELPLEDVIRQLQKTLEAIPPEHRAGAVLHVHASGEYATASLSVKYRRPETDEEMNARLGWLNSLDDDTEKRDRREFARLQKKYAPAGQ
jgi:hypothetical protein